MSYFDSNYNYSLTKRDSMKSNALFQKTIEREKSTTIDDFAKVVNESAILTSK